MSATGRFFLLAVGSLLAAFPAGCGEEKSIQISYDRPAAYDISANVRRLAIAEFGGTTTREKKWGDVASDLLASALDQYNREFHRYELVDRKRLKGIMDERDLQIAISDSSTSAQAGKLANVDAMIYGNVTVTIRDEHGTKNVFDPLSRSMKTVSYIKRFCMAAVNFTMDDVGTGKTLATVTATREYDSEKARKSKGGGAQIAGMLGMSGGDLPDPDQTVTGLIGECVEEFLSKVSPHRVNVAVKLQKGKSKFVDTGNKLAVAGEYKEALESYQRAIADRPDDDGALFNAGAMCEAMRDFAKAEEFYGKAFHARPDEKYAFARARVRGEQKAE